jgi:hypothetical protein
MYVLLSGSRSAAFWENIVARVSQGPSQSAGVEPSAAADFSPYPYPPPGKGAWAGVCLLPAAPSLHGPGAQPAWPPSAALPSLSTPPSARPLCPSYAPRGVQGWARDVCGAPTRGERACGDAARWAPVDNGRLHPWPLSSRSPFKRAHRADLPETDRRARRSRQREGGGLEARPHP